MAAAEMIDRNAGQTDRWRDRVRALITSDDTPKPAANQPDDEPTVSHDVLRPDGERKRERFIPVTRTALIDRLTLANAWKRGQNEEARRVFNYLGYWRQQQYNARLLELDTDYEPFSPDSELLQTRSYSAPDKKVLQKRVLAGITKLLTQANYEQIDVRDAGIIMTKDSHYGLDFSVDLDAFEEIMIWYRGASNRKYEQRSMRKFMRKVELDVPVFRRLFILFKLKPFAVRVEEIMQAEKLPREKAEKKLRKLLSTVPESIKEGNIYLKLFKDIPRSDLEMIFPNTRIRFLKRDKLRLGLTAGGGLGAGIFGAAGKMALIATNPIAAVTAAAGVGSIAFRQAMGVMSQKQNYMTLMSQMLYSSTMADNRGVILQIVSGAVEEDIKEEILLYSVLAKEKATRADLPAIDQAIEQWLTSTFGMKVDFDIYDALDRLTRDGIVSEGRDGSLTTLAPAAALKLIDEKWDVLLDNLPDTGPGLGAEIA